MEKLKMAFIEGMGAGWALANSGKTKSVEIIERIWQASRAKSAQETEQPDELCLEWRKGFPPHPWDKEWFIAVTTYGDRVVLKALPEEYTYDFKTADDTYIKREKIAKWMQFPDSNYIAPKREIVALPDWLMGSAQALLDMDASGSLVPHGIGGHARSIIEEFIKAHKA